MQRFLTTLSLTVLCLVPLPALAAFQCPASNAAKASDKPILSPEDVAGKDRAMSETLKSAIKRMQAEGMASGTIVDRLVVEDCSRIDAEANLSGDDKARQVRRFASKLANFIYTGHASNEEDIVVDVPVPTSVYRHLQQAAKKASMSEDAWVNQAIEAHLAVH